MASVGMKLSFGGRGDLQRISRRFDRLSDPDLRDLMEAIGSEVEAQTRTRIQDEKTAPDGTEWRDWSPEYAGKKHGRTGSHKPHPGQLRAAGGHSLLQLDGGLLDSIQYEAGRDFVIIGSNLVYARKVNSERQFLGLGATNIEDVEALTVEILERRLR